MAGLPPELVTALLGRLRGGRSDISQTIGKGVTRRDVMKGVGELVGRGKKSAYQMDDEELGRELEYYIARDAIEKNPKLWSQDFGPLSEADHDDIVDAAFGIDGAGLGYDVPHRAEGLQPLIEWALKKGMLR